MLFGEGGGGGDDCGVGGVKGGCLGGEGGEVVEGV